MLSARGSLTVKDTSRLKEKERKYIPIKEQTKGRLGVHTSMKYKLALSNNKLEGQRWPIYKDKGFIQFKKKT